MESSVGYEQVKRDTSSDSETEYALTELEKNREQIRLLLPELETRLGLVLRESPPQTDDKAAVARSLETKLASRIYDNANDLAAIRQFLNTLINRLEL